MATYDESLVFFRQLDAASVRIQLVEVGRTSEGKAWYFALISTPENLANVERYRAIAQRLAHPQGLTDDEALRLAREGKPFVHIDGGLHASEVAGAQHTIQLAYDLVSATNDPKIQAILDNVVVLLWPSLNPDGQNIVVNWYRSNVGTPYEVAPLKQLYQKYIGHDNNRDAYMLNMVESRVVTRTWRHWEPQIIHVHHQSSPFPTRIWLPPFAEPIASQAPPIISRTVNMIGMAMAQGLEANGQPGATHMGTGFKKLVYRWCYHKASSVAKHRGRTNSAKLKLLPAGCPAEGAASAKGRRHGVHRGSRGLGRSSLIPTQSSPIL